MSVGVLVGEPISAIMPPDLSSILFFKQVSAWVSAVLKKASRLASLRRIFENTGGSLFVFLNGFLPAQRLRVTFVHAMSDVTVRYPFFASLR